MHRKLKNIKLRNQKRSAGFTITEVVTASALLIIVIVPLLKALTSAHASGTTIERKTRSLVLARSKLDDIKARLVYDDWMGTFTENNTSLGNSYLCRVMDTPVAAQGAMGLKMISVTVGYDYNGNGVLTNDETEVTLATMIAQRS